MPIGKKSGYLSYAPRIFGLIISFLRTGIKKNSSEDKKFEENQPYEHFGRKKKQGKYLDLTEEQKKLCNMKMKLILIVITEKKRVTEWQITKTKVGKELESL